MKKLTKKAIKAAPQYVMIIDWMVEYKNGFTKTTLEADNLLDAMTEAEQYKDENVYLIKIAEKTAETYDNDTAIVYDDILTTRSYGWHRSDAQHSECAHRVAYYPEWDEINFI